jgi:hypothetical protein
MKTKTIIFGIVIAAISSISITTKAQLNQPEIRIVSVNDPSVIKVIYGYDTQETVNVTFSEANNAIILTDKINGEDIKGGFQRKYNMRNIEADEFWVEVTSSKLAAKYKVAHDKNGKWSAQLEKTTYNYPIVAFN